MLYPAANNPLVGEIKNLSPVPVNADPYCDKIVLLMHMDEVGFVDEVGHTVTPYGNAQISTAQSKFGSASAYFDGNGDYLVVSPTIDYAFGTEAFTVEFHLLKNNLESNTNNYILDTRPSYTNGAYFSVSTTYNNVHVHVNGVDVLTANGVLSNSFSHIAITQSDGMLLLFADGNLIASATSTTDFLVRRDGLYIGMNSYAGSGYTEYFLNGYIDDLRITKGVARYTANFTPPTEPGDICGTSGIYLVQADFRFEWETFGSIAESKQISWALLTPVSIDLTDSWEIFDWSTSIVAGFSWSLASVEYSTSQISWAIATVTAVNQTISWSSSSALSADFSQTFSIDGPLEVTQASTWSLVAPTTSEVQLSWAAELFSAVTAISSWSTDLDTVYDLELSWSFYAPASVSTEDSWSVGLEISVQLTDSWSVAIPAAITETVSWQHYNVSSTNNISWSVVL